MAELYRIPRLIGKIEKKPRWLSLNSRVVLLVTGILLIAGAVLVALADRLYAAGWTGGAGDSVFHSIVARTA